jgi:hypothetical protein
MGYDLNRFKGDVDEELICSICSGVLENPVQVCLHLNLSNVIGHQSASFSISSFYSASLFPLTCYSDLLTFSPLISGTEM